MKLFWAFLYYATWSIHWILIPITLLYVQEKFQITTLKLFTIWFIIWLSVGLLFGCQCPLSIAQDYCANQAWNKPITYNREKSLMHQLIFRHFNLQKGKENNERT
jgi:hypothetical protein